MGLRRIQAGDLPDLAEIHALSFERGWSSDQLADVLAMGPALCLEDDKLALSGFILSSCAGDEAEIITIAVTPERRATGAGRRLVEGMVRLLSSLGVQQLFLEVARDNHAALALYQRQGFEAVGTRPDYYEHASGRVDALIMRRALNSFES